MCYSCFEEYGRPVVMTEKVAAAVPLIRGVYDFCFVGGLLHVVLDDWNLEDDCISGCVESAAAGTYERPMTDTEKACAELMLSMSEDERATALALFDGFINPDGTPHKDYPPWKPESVAQDT